MSLTNYGEIQTLTLLKAAHDYYLAFFTASPSETGGGKEVSGGSYARKSVSFTVPATATDGTTSMKNSATIEFPTASADWGTVVGWGIFDAATGGNLYWYGSLTVTKSLTANDTILIHAGELVLTID